MDTNLALGRFLYYSVSGHCLLEILFHSHVMLFSTDAKSDPDSSVVPPRQTESLETSLTSMENKVPSP